MEEFDLSVDAQGPLYAGSVPAITGQVKGKSVSIAGVEVEDFEAAFERAGSSAAPAAGALPAPQSAQDFQVPGQGAPPPEVKAGAFSVPSLKGSYAGGRLSGNGSFGFGPPFSIDFDAVVSDFDASSLSELGGQVSGQAALVVKLSGAGQDAQSLSGSTKLSGSLLVSEGKWRDVRVGAQLFTPDLWRAVEEAAGVKLDASEEARLSGADDPIKDAKVSFDSSAGRTALSEMSWSQGGMEIRGTGEIAAGELKGEGEAALAKEAALRLASTPAARKALVGSGEKIVVPVKIAGKPSAPEFHADVAKFAAAVRERASVAAASAPAKKAPAPKPSAAPSQPAPAKDKGRAVAPAPAPFKPPPPPTEEQVDDILKVIIGR